MVVPTCLLPFWLKSNICSWVAHVFRALSPDSSSPEFCATFYVVSFACIASFVTMPRICLWVSSAISTVNSAQAQTLSQTFDFATSFMKLAFAGLCASFFADFGCVFLDAAHCCWQATPQERGFGGQSPPFFPLFSFIPWFSLLSVVSVIV